MVFRHRSYLRFAELDRIAAFDLTPELANRSGKFTANEAEWRMYAALHESAHLVANAACPDAGVFEVEVYANKRNIGGGRIWSAENRYDAETFVTLAGWYWENRYGDNPQLAQHDFRSAQYALSICPYLADETEAFVIEHKSVIERAAKCVLLLCDAKGLLKGKRLGDLWRWLRPQIRPFKPKLADPWDLRVASSLASTSSEPELELELRDWWPRFLEEHGAQA